MKELTPLDYINVGKAGTFADSGTVSTTPQQTDEIFKYLNENDIENLIIYFHGGLVSEKNGMGAASVMLDNFTSVEAKRHSVSFVWETGPKEVIIQNIDSIKEKAQKEFYQEALKFVIKIAAKRLGLNDTKGAGGQYLSDEKIEEEKYKDFPFEELDKTIDTKGGSDDLSLEFSDERRFRAHLENESKVLIDRRGTDEFKNTTTANDPQLTTDLEPLLDQEKKGGWLAIIKVVAEIAFKVLKRYFNKTHHDFYPTVMEETFRKLYLGSVGTWGWSRIKDKANLMFAPNDGLLNLDMHAGSYFLNSLQQHQAERLAKNKKFSINLIGHSAGSIVICYLLKSVMNNFQKLKFETVFFLAPACRVDLFLDTCKPARDKDYFKKFKMFTMKTENEKKDHCIPYVYTHSLLYLVSGLFELNDKNVTEVDSKILGLYEHASAGGRYDKFDELKVLKEFLNDYKPVLSDDNVNTDLSLRSTALSHGAFDNDTPTLTSILKSL